MNFTGRGHLTRPPTSAKLTCTEVAAKRPICSILRTNATRHAALIPLVRTNLIISLFTGSCACWLAFKNESTKSLFVYRLRLCVLELMSMLFFCFAWFCSCHFLELAKIEIIDAWSGEFPDVSVPSSMPEWSVQKWLLLSTSTSK